MPTVKFASDPEIKETGAGDGKAAAIPLSGSSGGTQVEMLSNGQDEGGDAEEERPIPRRQARPSNDEAQRRQDAAVDATFGDTAADEFADEEGGGPEYKRENIGARVGLPVDEANKIEDIQEQLDTEDRVPMMFQKEVRLNDRGFMHIWAPGLHLVPVSIAGESKKDKRMHFYLRHHGVRHAGPVVRSQPKQDDAAA